MTRSDGNPYRSPCEPASGPPIPSDRRHSKSTRRMPPSSLWALLFLFGPMLLGLLIGALIWLLAG